MDWFLSFLVAWAAGMAVLLAGLAIGIVPTFSEAMLVALSVLVTVLAWRIADEVLR